MTELGVPDVVLVVMVVMVVMVVASNPVLGSGTVDLQAALEMVREMGPLL